MYALNIDEKDGRILSSTFEEFGAPGQPLIEKLPDGDISEYRFVKGDYVYDPVPKSEAKGGNDDKEVVVLTKRQYEKLIKLLEEEK